MSKEKEKKKKSRKTHQRYIFRLFLFLIFRITISVGKGSRLFLIRAGTNVLFSWWRKTRLGERVVVGPNCTKASVPNGGESRLYACPTTSGAVYRDESVCLKQKAFVFEHRLLFRRYTHTYLDSHHQRSRPLCAKTSSFCRPIQKELVGFKLSR